jgi:hypothetical protein
MNTTRSPVTGQRLFARQVELIELVGRDHGGLSPKLEQIIRAFEATQIELAVGMGMDGVRDNRGSIVAHWRVHLWPKRCWI